jgi:hypothetical protein
MIADFSYKDTYGYYGLRAEPSFDKLIKSFDKKPTELRVPADREWKYYALGPYRSFILDASKRYNDFEALKLGYQNSGAALPDAAAAHTQPSGAEHDPVFERNAQQNDAMSDYELALDAANEEYRQRQAQAENMRRAHFSTYGPNLMNPTIEMQHQDLEEAQVDHYMPAASSGEQRETRYPAVPQQYIAAGVPQAPEFPTFEANNWGQTSRVFLPIHSLESHTSPQGNTVEHMVSDYGRVREAVTTISRPN